MVGSKDIQQQIVAMDVIIVIFTFKIIIQVSKNIFNKNDNNVGSLTTVKKVWIQEHSKQ